jgi:hypothetical protein
MKKLIFVAALFSGLCSAVTINYITPPDAEVVHAGPVDASVTFESSTGVLHITLTDLLGNPANAGQLISGLEYTLSVEGQSSLISSSAQQMSVDDHGFATFGSTGPAGWGFGTYQGNSIVCVVCGSANLSTPVGAGAGPAGTIIGPPDAAGMYTNANGSVAGSGSHNPFLNQTVTFFVANPQITSSTTVSNVLFSFGTTFGSDIAGIPGTVSDSSIPQVPEPSTFVLTAMALGAVLFVVRQRRKCH